MSIFALSGRIASYDEELLQQQVQELRSHLKGADLVAKQTEVVKQWELPHEVWTPSLVSVLVSAATLRIGITVLLVFLVQILVGVYRYALRLAAFYDARADALLLLRKDATVEVKIAEASKLLSAEKVSFGPEPKTPIENGMDALKDLAEILGKFQKGGKPE